VYKNANMQYNILKYLSTGIRKFLNVYLDFLFVYSNITVAKRLEFVQSIVSE